MTIADSVWLATALLHRENSLASDFSVQEIIQMSLTARRESYRPALPVFTSKHCVANKAPNPLRHRMLVETTRGRRRLFKTGDPYHPDRKDGKIRPERTDLPLEYQPIVDWYDEIYSKQSSAASPSTPLTPVTVPHQFPPHTDINKTDFSGFEAIRSHTAFVGPGGTVVLPEFLQRELDLKEGSCLSIYREKDRIVVLPITEDFIRSLRGSCKGADSLVEARDREHRDDKY